MNKRGFSDIVQLADFSEPHPRFRETKTDEAKEALQDPSRLAWVDISDNDDPESVIESLKAGSQELAGLDAERATRHNVDPTHRPPKAKRFHGFVFGRTYALRMYGSHPDEELAAQAVHLIVGRTFAISIRYPLLGWTIRGLATGREEAPHPVEEEGLTLEELLSSVIDFRGRFPRTKEELVFGLEVAAVVLDKTIDSTFDSIDGLRVSVNEDELVVLRKRDWLWKHHLGRELNSRMLGIRRMLRRIGWAFMPADEIAEFLAGPFLGIEDEDLGIKFQFDDLEREANRALKAAEDVSDQVKDAVALRDSIKADRLNNTAYVLTSVTAILLIPTLIAGLYGMNFEDLPPFGVRGGYIWVVASMFVLSAAVWLGIRAFLRHRDRVQAAKDDPPRRAQ